MSAMDEIPDRDQIAADEARIGALLRAVEVPAPAGLTQAILARRAPRRSRRVPAFALSFATACAVAVVVVLVAGGSSAPSVVRAARVALAAPVAAAPATLTATGTSIRFPNWSTRGWPATGIRHDSVGGRSLTTEFYRSYEAGTIGYTISSGAPLRWGSARVQKEVSGEVYELISSGGARIVTWVQDGHTCILASRTAGAQAMLALAAAERSTAA
jgi:hypothetical protein